MCRHSGTLLAGLRAICSFVDVRVFICRLLGLWSPVVSVAAVDAWLEKAGWLSMPACGFVAVRIFGQVSSSVWSASGLQPEAYFARAGRGRPPSS